jgi:hypothetical protein
LDAIQKSNDPANGDTIGICVWTRPSHYSHRVQHTSFIHLKKGRLLAKHGRPWASTSIGFKGYLSDFLAFGLGWRTRSWPLAGNAAIGILAVTVIVLDPGSDLATSTAVSTSVKWEEEPSPAHAGLGDQQRITFPSLAVGRIDPGAMLCPASCGAA